MSRWFIAALLLTVLSACAVAPNPTETLQQRLADAENGDATLHLDGLELERVPPAVMGLTHLEHLSLRDNALTTLPEDFSALANLQTLDLGGNQLNTLPATLTTLTTLQTLDLSDNQLTALDENIEAMTGLQTLDLSGNQLNDVPVALGTLPHLQALHVADNPLHAFPAHVRGVALLPHLQAQVIELHRRRIIVGLGAGLLLVVLVAWRMGWFRREDA